MYDRHWILLAILNALRSDILIPQPDGIPEPTRHHDGQDVYFEILELQPVLVSVSFVRNLSTANSTTGR